MTPHIFLKDPTIDEHLITTYLFQDLKLTHFAPKGHRRQTGAMSQKQLNLFFPINLTFNFLLQNWNAYQYQDTSALVYCKHININTQQSWCIVNFTLIGMHSQSKVNKALHCRCTTMTSHLYFCAN